MQAFLNLYAKLLAFGDPTANSNPKLRAVDWDRSILGQTVNNPRSEGYQIPAGQSLTVFSTVRSTSLDNTTSFDFVNKDPTHYRFTWNGTGTNPAFRTDRGLTCATHTITWAVQLNQTVLVSSSTTVDFASVVVGDVLFVPGVTTNDTAGPFNLLNEGAWTVLAKDGTNTILTVARPPGTQFIGASESQLVASNGQLMAFSTAGVQIGDKVDVAGGYPASMVATYPITNVTSKWFEILSATPLPSSILGYAPGTANVQFFSSAKRVGYVEADQECAVQANGSTDLTQRVSPWVAGDPNNVGWWIKVGALWQLTIVNRSVNTANVSIISAE